jgi:hypothetical protein
MDFAERLGVWLNAFDAIELQAAHQSIKAIRTAAPGKPAKARSTRAQSVDVDFQQVRSVLANAIARVAMPLPGATSAPADSVRLRPGLAHPPGPAGVHSAASAADASFAPYQQRHLELQRQMEQMISPLRDHVRQTLCTVSPRLRQLAVLDSVLEHLLAPREQMLLPTVATRVERRFEQLHLAHRQSLEATGQQDDPVLWRQAGGWLDVFGKDWRQALLAELDLRLEPTAGLIEALSNELKNKQ